MKKILAGLALSAAMMGMFSINAGAVIIKCPGSNHADGIPSRMVNPHCSGIVNIEESTCLMHHIQPCSVRVTKAYTAYYCEEHGNEVVIGDETHYERIVHIDGNNEIVLDRYPCPY